MTETVHPVILCGGSGTRLWPLSTPERPKQFLALTSSETMIQETAKRFSVSHQESLRFQAPLVIGSVKHQALLEDLLPGLDLILEPMGRNSAPAVAAACLVKRPEDLILILPADHVIEDVPAFHAAIDVAAAAAREGSIVTFGIKPDHAATGYGYIKTEGAAALNRAVTVEAFVEKPNLETAEAYLKSGSYLWNAGIFLFQARTMLSALREHAPDILPPVEAALASSKGAVRSLQATAFAKTPSISVDYAVMEKAPNVQTVPVEMGWNDVGGYPALHDMFTETPRDNFAVGPVTVRESSGLYVRSEGPTIGVSGVSDLAIVATHDTVMVAPKSDAAAIKALGAQAQAEFGRMGLSDAMRKRVRDWLWSAFDVWSHQAWDNENGGFVEQLDMQGHADRNADRRVRVQARQIYSFSKAIELEWSGGEQASYLVAQGLDYVLTRLKHDTGGFVHRVRADGSVLDARHDLYDHAFMMLAGAAANRATGNPKGLELAHAAFDFVETHLKDSVHGGYFEASTKQMPRRSNPHMHLLEASMELYAATGEISYLKKAGEIVTLFESKFFDSGSNTLREFFEEDWSPSKSQGGGRLEPGHHYEWATLLAQYERLTGRDLISWRRRLIRTADRIGRDAHSGFAHNCIKADGTILDGARRLWPQFEMLRAYLIHPGISTRSPEQLLEAIFDSYLDKGPKGGWNDETDEDGRALSMAVPASMLYHAVTAFAPLLR